MKTHRFFALVAGLMLAGAAQAQQVVSYFAQIPQSTTNWTKMPQLPGFDSNLGTLTQVKLSYSGEVWQSLFTENQDGNGSSYDLLTTATLSLAKTGGPALFTPAAIVLHRTGSVTAFDGSFDFGGTSGVTFSQDQTVSGMYLDPSLASYISTSPIGFTATARGVSSWSTSGNSASGALTSAASSLGVEYTYVAIPEPSAYAALLGAAVLGIVTIRRKQARIVD